MTILRWAGALALACLIDSLGLGVDALNYLCAMRVDQQCWTKDGCAH
jgi:hypothetical protein